MKKAYIMLILGIFCLMYTVHDFYSILPVPIFVEDDPIKVKSEEMLRHAGCPEKRIPVLAHAVSTASKSTGGEISPALIVALVKTESTYKSDAVSSKGYKGLMQTPKATFEYADVDILYGVRILKDKIHIANGNLELALALYKGGNNPEAKRYAKQTLNLYIQLASR